MQCKLIKKSMRRHKIHISDFNTIISTVTIVLFSLPTFDPILLYPLASLLFLSGHRTARVMDKCRRWGQKVSWCRATAWLTLHPQLTLSNGKSQHMPPHVLCLKSGKSCSLLLCVWVIYPAIANLWISNWEGHVCVEDFPLGRSYSAELTNMKVSKGDGLWEVSEKRRININQFMFKGVINDKLKLAWTEQVPSFRSRWISMFFVRLRCETILSPIYIERRRVLFCIEWQWMEIFKALH